MIANRALWLGIALGLITGTPLLGDEPGDRAKLRDALMEREKEAWELTKRQDVAAARAFYPADVMLILHDGTRLDHAANLKFIADFQLDSYAIDEKVDLVILTPEAATLVYRVTTTGALKGMKPQQVTALASSTYVRRGGKWVNVFYQETSAK